MEKIRSSPLLCKAVPLLASVITGTAFASFLDFQTTNPFSVLFLFLLYPLYQNALQKRDKKITVTALVSGFLFAMFLWARKMTFYQFLNSPKAFTAFIILLGLFLFFTAMTANLYEKIRNIDMNAPPPALTKKKKALIFWGSVTVMFLCWLPYFLYLYPGDVTADSISELNQAEGNEALSNHHPIAHTFMIKLFFDLGQFLFHDDNMAVGTYSICQAVLLAMSFAYLILTMYEFGFRKRWTALVFLYYAGLSYHACYSFTMWKDIWFAGIMTAFAVTLWRVFVRYEISGGKLPDIPFFENLMLYIMGAGVCLFRSNGLYAYMFFLVFFAWYHIRKKHFRPLITCVTALAVALIIKIPVYNALHVTPPDTIESLSIPAQHIAGTLHDGAELTPEENELLSHIVDVSRISETYVSEISDPVKNLVRETDNQEYLEEHKLEFLKLWIDLGLRHPASYLKAQVSQTYGYFYPDVQYWVYPGEFRNDNFQFQKNSLVPEAVGKLLNEWRNLYYHVHYLGMFWSIGFMTWIVVFMTGAVFVKKSKKFLLIYLPVIGVILTLMIATPVFSEFRYAYCVFTGVPLFCVIPFLNTGILKENITALPAKEKNPEAEA